jgi:AmmeMemoRadiSam system protein B/AmmeMemoRadiSam system protein A
MQTETLPAPFSQAFALSPAQEQAILKGAARVLAGATQGRDVQLSGDDLAGAAGLPVLGAFVSLKRGGRLRSCCGFLGQIVPAATALVHAAKRTANEDHRFPPVTVRELPHLDVEVWLLSNQQPMSAKGLARKDAIEIGKHGLQIARGNSRGLLLPGVAVDHELDAEQFLEHVCLKAELPPTAWKEDDTALWTFEGHAIKSPLSEVLPQPTSPAPLAMPIRQQDLGPLADYCKNNLMAFATGATPSYFAFGLPDGNVHGLILGLVDAAGNEIIQGNKISLKDVMPLQSTLFSMTEGLAKATQQARLPPERVRELRLALTILCAPALHGAANDPDVRGLDPRCHMTIVIERNRTAAIFDPAQSAVDQVATCVREAGITIPEAAQVYGMECLTNLNKVRVVHVPRAAGGTDVRPAGVAGRFYPADPQELAALVDQCLPKERGHQEQWPAIMLPHAGLIYSGKVAGQTLNRVKIPSKVIVIGPKHTPHGVEWAVAPHKTWSIPGGTLASDPGLGQRLCQAIAGLQLDAAAHAQEHAIEVELPFLARLAPNSKVLGIAIGGGNLSRCRQFASGLAKVIRDLPEPPLLVISSDMNHFASDAENRRLDEIALKAMETLDAEQLYNTVVGQRISMCGLLPAVIVMETLKELGQLQRTERVAYATSADASGDKSRVVGYAGMLLGT